MTIFVRLFLGVSLAFLLATAPLAHGQAGSERPNVIVIALDTLRADYLGAYGNKTIQTPNLDALAAESIVFEKCYAPAPWTLPSFTSFFTGAYPYTHGVVGGERKTLSGKIATMAQILQLYSYYNKGYAAVTWLYPEIGGTRGFREFHFSNEGAITGRLHKHQERALEWIQSKPENPYFLFLHYFDIHAPYMPPEPYDRMYYEGNPQDPSHTSMEVVFGPENRANWHKDPEALYGWLKPFTDIDFATKQYGAGVTYVDHYVGQILDSLRETGALDNAIVVVMSDHGEHLTEHDIYFTHGLPYEEALRVPLTIRMPDGQYGGRRIQDEVSLVDFLPTLLDILDIPMQGNFDGTSLWPAMQGEKLPQRLLMAEQGDTPGGNMVKAVWDDRYRMLYFSVNDSTFIELYDRRKDPLELTNIAAENPSVVQQMEKALWGFIDPEHPISTQELVETRPLDPAMIERLRSLGYTP